MYMEIEFLDDILYSKDFYPWQLSFEEFIGEYNVDQGYSINGRQDFKYEWIWEEVGLNHNLSEILSEREDGYYVKRIISSLDEKETYVLFTIDDEPCGFYSGVECYIDFYYRGQELSTLLIATSSIDQGGSPNTEGLVGFSPTGIRAHEKAYDFLVQFGYKHSPNMSIVK